MFVILTLLVSYKKGAVSYEKQCTLSKLRRVWIINCLQCWVGGTAFQSLRWRKCAECLMSQKLLNGEDVNPKWFALQGMSDSCWRRRLRVNISTNIQLIRWRGWWNSSPFYSARCRMVAALSASLTLLLLCNSIWLWVISDTSTPYEIRSQLYYLYLFSLLSVVINIIGWWYSKWTPSIKRKVLLSGSGAWDCNGKRWWVRISMVLGRNLGVIGFKCANTVQIVFLMCHGWWCWGFTLMYVIYFLMSERYYGW